MSCRDILVFLDESKASGQSVDVAMQLAQVHGAHLTGLAVAVEQRVPAFVEAHIPKDLLAAQAREPMAPGAQLGGVHLSPRSKRRASPSMSGSSVAWNPRWPV